MTFDLDKIERMQHALGVTLADQVTQESATDFEMLMAAMRLFSHLVALRASNVDLPRSVMRRIMDAYCRDARNIAQAYLLRTLGYPLDYAFSDDDDPVGQPFTTPEEGV